MRNPSPVLSPTRKGRGKVYTRSNRIFLMRPVDTSSAVTRPARSRTRWASWVTWSQLPGDSISTVSASMPRTGQGAPPAISGPLTVAVQSSPLRLISQRGAGVGRNVAAGDRRRHGLAPAELLEGEHAASAEIDPHRSFLARLQGELERAALGGQPAVGAAAQREGHAVLGHRRLAVAPRQIEQRRLVGIEPGAGQRLDLGLGEGGQGGLQSLVAFQRQRRRWRAPAATDRCCRDWRSRRR